MEKTERMPGKQSDREGRNAPDPGTMPEEFVEESPNRSDEPADPDEEREEEGVTSDRE